MKHVRAETLTFQSVCQLVRHEDPSGLRLNTTWISASIPVSVWYRGQCVAKTKEQKQELFHFLQRASRQCIGTMDTRLCSVYTLYLTNERQRENSLCGDAVTLKLTGLHLLRLYKSLWMYTYCLWVRQRPESVIVLLSCCVPQAQVYWFPINHHIGRVIVKAVKEYAEISQPFSIPCSARGVSVGVSLTLWGCTRQGRHS